jgi:uncharacterized membrane protein HdeD (DUF308 family)
MTPDQPTAKPAPIAWPEMNTPASPPAPPAPSEPEPLSNAQHALVRDAVNRRRIVKHAGTVARSSAVVMLIIGVTALMTTIFSPSWQSYLVSVGLCIVGIVEYKGSSRLRRADIKAPRILGMNQLALLAIIVLYCAVQMVSFSNKDVKDAIMSPDFRSQLSALPDMKKFADTADRIAPLIVYGFYSLVIILTGCFQGGMAGYYFGRKKYIETYNRQTPQWIKRLLAEMDA